MIEEIFNLLVVWTKLKLRFLIDDRAMRKQGNGNDWSVARASRNKPLEPQTSHNRRLMILATAEYNQCQCDEDDDRCFMKMTPDCGHAKK